MKTFFSSWNIRSSLYFLALVAILPALAVILVNGWSDYRNGLVQAREQATALSTTIAAQQEQFVNSTRMLLTTLSSIPDVRALDAESVDPLLQEIIKYNPGYANIILVDRDGRLQSAAFPYTKNSDLSERKYFKDSLETKRFSAGEYTIGRSTAEPSFHFALPMLDEHDELIGVVVAAMRLNVINSLASRFSTPLNSRTVLIDHAGIRLYRYPSDTSFPIGEKLLLGAGARRFFNDTDINKSESSIWDGVDSFGNPTVYAFTRLCLGPDQKPYMTVITATQHKSLIDLMTEAPGRAVAALALSLAFALAIARWVGEAMAGAGIQRLTEAASRFSAGDFSTRMGDVRGCLEIKQLAKTFDVMTTELANREASLVESEKRFRNIIESSPDIISLSTMPSGNLVEVNAAFTRETGYTREEAIGKTTEELGLYTDLEARRRLYETLAVDGRVENLEFEWRCKDGTVRLFSVSCQLMDLGGLPTNLAILRDITASKQMQLMLIQTEKMISVGGIAAGIAHEINNPLGIILQAAQNIAQRTQVDFQKNRTAAEKCGVTMEQIVEYLKVRKLDEFINDIQEAAIRASGIIRHMLDFSRRSESRRAQCHLPTIIDKAVSLAASDFDLKKSYDFKRIEVTKECEEPLPILSCTETEIEQVILNLLRNAAQALASASQPVENPRIVIRVASQPGGVRLDIEDNGPGIPLEIQRRIFEPFFTTKAPGIGTGLGLSVSYFIVTKGHGGTMSVASTPGQGTKFTITLPANAWPGG